MKFVGRHPKVVYKEERIINKQRDEAHVARYNVLPI